MTSPAIDELVADIEMARSDFTAFVTSLPAENLVTPLADGKWTPVEYLEHLVLAEEATLWRMFGAVEEGRDGSTDAIGSTPAESIEEVIARTWEESEKAPPLAVPKLRGSATYWLVRLRRNSFVLADFAQFVRIDELDTFAYLHPISGPLTIRQGLEFIRFHLDRHRRQLVSQSQHVGSTDSQGPTI